MIPVVSTGNKAFDYQNSVVFIGLKPKVAIEKTNTQDCLRLALNHHNYGYNAGRAAIFLEAYKTTFNGFDIEWGKDVLKECFHIMADEDIIETAYLYFLHHARRDRRIMFHGALLTGIEPSFTYIKTWNKQANNVKTELILDEMQRFLTGKTFHIPAEIAVAKRVHPNKRYSFKTVFDISIKQYLRKKSRMLRAPL